MWKAKKNANQRVSVAVFLIDRFVGKNVPLFTIS